MKNVSSLVLLAAAAGAVLYVRKHKSNKSVAGIGDLTTAMLISYSKHWPKDGTLTRLFNTYDRLHAEKIRHEEACDEIWDKIVGDKEPAEADYKAYERALYEAGLCDENGYTYVYERSTKAWQDLVSYIISNIIPPSERDLFWSQSRNITQMQQLVDFVRRHLGINFY